MNAKKDEYRFTLQFNPSDPNHKHVATILNRQGRRKAQYIVNAVLCYENQSETATQGQPHPLDYHTIETIVNQILTEKTIQQDYKDEESTTKDKINTKKSKELNLDDVSMALGEEGLSAIASSIAAFRQK